MGKNARNWVIRTALPKDAIDLQNCMIEAYKNYKERMGGKHLPPMDVDYAAEIRDFPSWVVELESKIIGGLFMMFEYEYASIANIAVHPNAQGLGVGGGLMRFAEEKAKKKKYTELRLATHVLLTENLGLYIHLGWTEYNRDEVRVYMKKRI